MTEELATAITTFTEDEHGFYEYNDAVFDEWQDGRFPQRQELFRVSLADLQAMARLWLLRDEIRAELHTLLCTTAYGTAFDPQQGMKLLAKLTDESLRGRI